MVKLIAEVQVGGRDLWFIYNPSEDILNPATQFEVTESLKTAMEWCLANGHEFDVMPKEDREEVLNG